MNRRYTIQVYRDACQPRSAWVAVSALDSHRVVYVRLHRLPGRRGGGLVMMRPTPYLLLRVSGLPSDAPSPMGLEPTRAEEMAARRAFARALLSPF